MQMTSKKLIAILSGRRRTGRDYDVFLSYSHRLDRGVAPAIQTGLQQLAKPWYRRHALRVFRDATDLGASPELWRSIRSALIRSKHFVLLASPEAATSRWVQRELKLWLRLNGSQRLYVAVTSGPDPLWTKSGQPNTPANPIPLALAKAYWGEPMWVDFRQVRNDAVFRRDNEPLRDALACLAGPIWGITPAELIGEDYRQFRRTVRTVWAVSLTFAVLLVVAIGASLVADTARRQAVHQAQIAQSRQLAAESEVKRKDNLDASLLLSAAAFDIEPTREARDSLLATLEYSPHLDSFLHSSARNAGYAVVSPDGKVVVSAGSDRKVIFWDRATGREKNPPIVIHTAAIRRLVFSSDGGRVASGDASGHIVIWDAVTGATVTSMDHGPGGISGLSFNSDGKILASASLGDPEVRFWETADGHPRGGGIRTPDTDLESISFHPHGTMLATLSGSEVIRLWELHGPVQRPRQTREMHHPKSPERKRDANKLVAISVRRGGGVLGDVAFSPDGRILASRTGASSEIVLWNPERGNQAGTLAGDAVWGALAFSGDSKWIGAGDLEGNVVVWDVEKKSTNGRPMLAHRGVIASVSLDRQGDTLVSTGSDDNRVALWDLGRANHLAETLRSQARIDAITFLPGGKKLVEAGRDPAMVVWDLQDVSRRHTVLPGDDRAEVIAVATDVEGKTFASATENEITIWDTSSWKVLRKIAQDRKVSSLALTPDGKILAIGSWGSYVELRSVDTGAALGRLAGPKSYVISVAFDPAGAMLAAGWGRSGLARSPTSNRRAVKHRGSRQFSPQARES